MKNFGVKKAEKTRSSTCQKTIIVQVVAGNLQNLNYFNFNGHLAFE